MIACVLRRPRDIDSPPLGLVLGDSPQRRIGDCPELGTQLGTVPGQKTVDPASDPAVRAAWRRAMSLRPPDILPRSSGAMNSCG